MNDDYLLKFQKDQLMPNNHLMPNKKYPNLQIIHEANDCSKIEEEDDSLVKEDQDSFGKHALNSLSFCLEETSFGDSSNPEEPRAALEK